MKCLVTGAAGFIGSHLSEKLVDLGYEVVGMDSFEDFYPRGIKERNLERLRDESKFILIEENLLKGDLPRILEGVDFVFHEAAQAGVRTSWGEHFNVYVDNNIRATQRLLEAVKEFSIKKFVFASSSSVYGDVDHLPMREDGPTRPVSPYGVTKLAAENLCYLSWKNFGVPVVCLRYFTVYGPRQRPDMAFHRFIRAILKDREIIIYGDGEQTRDFTYVSDVVEANVLAMREGVVGKTFNIGGGSRLSVNKVLRILEGTMGKRARVRYADGQKGDMRDTFAATDLARDVLGFKGRVKVEEGLQVEVDWLTDRY